MRNWILGLVLFIVWLIGCRYYYVCEIKQMCGEKGPIEVVDDVRAKTLTLMDGDKIALEKFDQFKFGNGIFKPDLNEDNKDFIARAAAYLAENPNKKLTITGSFLPSEPNFKIKAEKDSVGYKGFLESIGMARAEAIKNLLVEAGMDGDRILLNEKKLAEGSDLSNPISFSASGPDGEEEGIPEGYGNEGGEVFSFTNMSFSDTNFEKESANFNPGSQFTAYADSVKTYLSLEENKGLSLTLTGHACNLGSDDFNMKLGLERAKSVKQYFKSIGITAKIATDSKGETAPAFPNDDDNRYKNRRVNVKIK